jgi:hypothetical protein
MTYDISNLTFNSHIPLSAALFQVALLLMPWIELLFRLRAYRMAKTYAEGNTTRLTQTNTPSDAALAANLPSARTMVSPYRISSRGLSSCHAEHLTDHTCSTCLSREPREPNTFE